MCPQYLRSVASYISSFFFFLFNYWKTWLQLCLWCFHQIGCLIKYFFSSYSAFFHSSLLFGTAAKMKVRAQLEHPSLHKVKVLRIVSEIHPILKFMVNMSPSASVIVELSDISVGKETNITIQSILILIKFKEHSSIVTIVRRQITLVSHWGDLQILANQGLFFPPINRTPFPF